MNKSTRISTLETFQKEVEELKYHQPQELSSKLNHFQEVIAYFRLTKPSKAPSLSYESKLERLTKTISDLYEIKDVVIGQRLHETKDIIKQHPEVFRISTFELMEHNFRENTHSNVLRYYLIMK